MGIKAIVAEVQTLAGNNIPSSVVFAKELVAVLAKHNISLPDDLRRLAEPKPPVPKPKAAEVTRIYQQAHKISILCEESTWTKNIRFGVSVSLRNDLLAAITKFCPSSFARIEAAWILVRRATPDGEGKRAPDVTPAVASKAAEAAITYALDNSSGALGPDSISALKYMQMFGAINMAISLKAMTLDKPTKESLDKIVKHWNAMITAAQQGAKNNKKAGNILKLLAKQLKVFGAQTEQCAKMFSDIKAIRIVLKAFYAAVNKNDAKEAEKFLTPKTAAKLRLKKEKTSCLEWVSDSHDVKEIQLISVGPITTIGTRNMAQVQLTIIDSRGRPKQTVSDLRMSKIGSNWLIGEK